MSALPPLVAFETARAHLGVTDTAHDALIQSKLDQASAIVRDYLKASADPAWPWDETTAPLPVQAATERLLAGLYEHRGDAMAPDDVDGALWEAVARLLVRFRHPALA